jgi:phenylacetate-CoA ligase
LKDLEKIPPTSEDDLRNGPRSFLAIPLKNIWRVFATSGTTGKPKIIFREPLSLERPEILSVWKNIFRRTHFWPQLAAVMRPAGGLAASGPVASKVLELLKIPCFSVSPEGDIGNTAEVLASLKPDLLIASPSFLALVIYTLKKKRIRPKKLGAKVIISTGEPLRSNERFYLEKELGARVINTYGAADPSVWLASECPKGALHILPYTSYIETVDAAGRPGPEGELLVTPFANRAMPLIRYRLGDRARLSSEKCACGRRLPQIVSLERSEKSLVLKAGKSEVKIPIRKALTQIAAAERRISSFFNLTLQKISGRSRMKITFEADFFNLKKSVRQKIEKALKKQFLNFLEKEKRGMGKTIRVEISLAPIGTLPRRAAKLISQITES